MMVPVNCGYTCLTSYKELAHNDDLLMTMTEYDRDEASTTVHLLSFITTSIVIQSYSFTTVTATSIFSLTLILFFVLFTRLLEFDLRLISVWYPRFFNSRFDIRTSSLEDPLAAYFIPMNAPFYSRFDWTPIAMLFAEGQSVTLKLTVIILT